jgi:hypothetical protein
MLCSETNAHVPCCYFVVSQNLILFAHQELAPSIFVKHFAREDELNKEIFALQHYAGEQN